MRRGKVGDFYIHGSPNGATTPRVICRWKRRWKQHSLKGGRRKEEETGTEEKDDDDEGKQEKE